jgi:hypothetical protein
MARGTGERTVDVDGIGTQGIDAWDDREEVRRCA